MQTNRLQPASIHLLVSLATALSLLPTPLQAGLDDGLLVHYRLDGNATDSSTNAFHGINEGAVGTADRNGNANSAFLFDGSSQVRVPDNDALDFVPGNSYTISMWIRRDGSPDPQHIIGKREGGAWWQVAWGSPATGANLRTEELPLGFWTHVATICRCTANAYTTDTYVNGTLTSGNRDIGFPAGPNNADLLLGGSGGFAKFVGALDDVRIYNRALSLEDIQQLSSPEAGPTMTIAVSEVRVCWTSMTNATYRVDYRSDLTTNSWATLSNCVLSGGSETCITDQVFRGQPHRYYRVVVTNCVPGL